MSNDHPHAAVDQTSIDMLNTLRSQATSLATNRDAIRTAEAIDRQWLPVRRVLVVGSAATADARSLGLNALERILATSHAAVTAGVITAQAQSVVLDAINAAAGHIAGASSEEVTHTDSDNPVAGVSQTMALEVVPTTEFNIDADTVMYLMDSAGCTQAEIAALYKCGKRTVGRFIANNGISKRKRNQLSDENLDSLVRTMTAGSGSSWGAQMVSGLVRAVGHHVTTLRVAQSVARVNPLSRCYRQSVRVMRRLYTVKGPNAVWHVDAHLKLFLYGFYIQGCIDGGSRFVIYIQCADNNRALTTLTPFKSACEQYQGCSRLRIDKGSENVLIAKYQLRWRGVGR